MNYYRSTNLPISFTYPSYLTTYEEYMPDGEHIKMQIILYEENLHRTQTKKHEAIFVGAPSISISIYEKKREYGDLEKWIRNDSNSLFLTNNSPTADLREFTVDTKRVYLHDLSLPECDAGVYVLESKKYVIEILEKLTDGNSAQHKKYQNILEEIIKTITEDPLTGLNPTDRPQ